MLKKLCLSICLLAQGIVCAQATSTINSSSDVNVLEQAQGDLSTSLLGAQSLNEVQSSHPINDVLATAKSLIGTPYRAGGTTPSGFDCSGFMQYVFRQSIGIDLPRTSRDMATVGEKVARDALQVGDMVFFAHSGSRISHVGMYVGEGQFIHSPSSGKTVEITSMHSKYWQPRFITARRLALS